MTDKLPSINIYEQLAIIQSVLKAPKGQTNDFGKYKYRSCEDILEAVKPLLDGLVLTISDEMVQLGERYYVKATAKLASDEGHYITNSAFARESLDKKGMDDSQITGATSSYARKYALNGLFAIDDTKDFDTMDNTKPTPATTKTPTKTTGGIEVLECPEHKVKVTGRISNKNNRPYWLCTAGEKTHFLDDPNKQFADEKLPWTDTAINNLPSEIEVMTGEIDF